eukprot:7848006-Pyramimonas_sp.AAC.1
MRLRLGDDCCCDPISIFEESFDNQFVAYCASDRPCVSFPRSGSAGAGAGFFHRAGELVNFVRPSWARCMAAVIVMEYLIRLHRLAPFNVPPLATLWRQCNAQWSEWSRGVRLSFRVISKNANRLWLCRRRE